MIAFPKAPKPLSGAQPVNGVPAQAVPAAQQPQQAAPQPTAQAPTRTRKRKGGKKPPAAAGANPSRFRTVKVQEAVHARLQALLDFIGAHGWDGIGSLRGDRHTVSAVLDEALAALETRKRSQL